MALHPVGPLPAAHYWRRRAVLGVVVLLVLLLLRSCIGGGAANKNALVAAVPTQTPTQAATPTASPTPAPTVTATPRPTTTGATTATPSVAATPSTGPVESCPDSVLVVVASADAPSYAVGAQPVLRLSVRNGSRVACRRNFGGAAIELRVLSGNDRLWSSDDCTTGGLLGPVVLQPGETRSTSLVWSGRRSLPGCGGDKALAQPGTYRVFARVGTLTRDGGSFTMTAA